jgi:hypothetical protein
MSSRQATAFNQIEDRPFQTQEPRSVTNCCSILSGFCGNLFLGQMKFIRQTFVGARLFDRVEVLALNIFDQGYLERRLIANLTDDRGHAAQAGSLRRAPSTFAGEKLISRSDAPQYQRLDDSTNADGLSKFG